MGVFEQRAIRFAILLSAILGLLLFNAWFLYYNFNQVARQEQWVRHTYEVISELDLVRTSVVEMETGQRGYLLTREEAFLEPHQRGTAQFAEHAKRLQRLVADNATQRREIESLVETAQKRISHLNQILEAERSRQGNPVAREEHLREGRDLMAQLRLRIEKIKDAERDLLRQREEVAKRARVYFYLALFATTLVSIVAVGVAGRMIKKNQDRMEIESRERAMIARIRENIAAASAAVTGTLTPEQLARKVQGYLADNLGILASKVFTFSSGRLQVISAYGTDDNGEARRSLVDEAVLRSGIWYVGDVPEDYWRIGSSLGESRPRSLVFMPLTFQGRKLGVIEMAFFREPTDEDREVLAQLVEPLSIGLSAAQSRSDLQELLEKTQQQAEELEAQQEELKASNEELEQQARALESQQQTLNIKNRELEEARLTLEAKAIDLQLSTQYKSDFLAKMSHELRTPLNGLLILSTLLIENKEKNLNEQQRQFARSIHSAGNDLLMLINDILDLSKIEARKLAIKPEDFKIGSVIESLKLAFSPQADAKGLTFNIETSGASESALHTDRQRLEQILRNFLSNAIKFTDKGSITLEAKLVGSRVEFSVADTGIGIPQAKQQLIFEAFEQADGTVSRKFGGTGLGLTISRELASLLGGEILVESREGEGSRFTLSIPLRLGASATQAPSAPPPAVRIAPNPAVEKTLPGYEKLASEALRGLTPGARTILVVEDDENFLTSVLEAARTYGFEPIPARDGETAMAILEQHTPDAILLDIKLPGISGLGLLEMVKQRPQLRHIPVHMISGLDYQHSALRMGALGYLTKPVTMEKIRSALERVETLVSGQMRKILLIEDDERQSHAIKSLIAGADVEIDSVNTGKMALERLRSITYDCVILDLSLPDMTGFEMLEQFNSLPVSIPPIVIYTAKDLSSKEEEYLRKYSESIIIKGARSPERLLDEVNLFLHRVESLLPLDKREMLSQLRSQKDGFDGQTVLIVDDDLRNVFALTAALETKNLNVRIAKDGVEALEELGRNADISLVLMDIMMPRMDGFEAMRRIRKSDDPRLRSIPIVALTAKAMREDHEKCIEAGASDYIPKPVDMTNLTTLLKVWLAPKGIFA